MATTAEKQAEVPAIDFIGFIHEGVPVATENLDACIAFYTEVLGLKLLPRPKALDEFGPGAWLGDEGDTVQFHLIANDKTLRPGSGARVEPAGRHTAWRVRDMESMRARLRTMDIPFEEISSLIGEAQLFVIDPEGHTWEFQGPPSAGG